MTRRAEKQKAIELRQLGYSYNLIGRKLGIPKSTLSDWLSEVPYQPNAIVTGRIMRATEQLTKVQRKNKLLSLVKAQKEARKELPRLSKRDLWMIGLGLYIGEGAKSNSSVRFANSDPQTVKLMIRWLREVIGLTNQNIRLTIHLYPDNDEEIVKKFWSELTHVPLSQFAKSQIDIRKDKSLKKKNILPYGTIHITVLANGNSKYGVFLFRKIMFWAEQAFAESRV